MRKKYRRIRRVENKHEIITCPYCGHDKVAGLGQTDHDDYHAYLCKCRRCQNEFDVM